MRVEGASGEPGWEFWGSLSFEEEREGRGKRQGQVEDERIDRSSREPTGWTQDVRAHRRLLLYTRSSNILL